MASHHAGNVRNERNRCKGTDPLGFAWDDDADQPARTSAKGHVQRKTELSGRTHTRQRNTDPTKTPARDMDDKTRLRRADLNLKI